MEQPYFNNIRSKIIPHLENAKNEIVIAMAWFTSGELFQALLNCRKRGVVIKLVLLDNASNFMDYAPNFSELIKVGGEINIAKVEDGFMHHKFCIVDNKIIITGSYNWTYYAEIRNIENIIISDNIETVRLYHNEFDALFSRTPVVSECPKYSWDEIEEFQHIDFDELNYEIENIAKVRNLPERKIIKSSTKITIEHQAMNPVSRFNIGLRVTTKGNNDAMETFIKSGEKLPFTSAYTNFYNAIEQRANAICDIIYEANGKKNQIKSELIKRITGDSKIKDLTIRVQFTLMPTGYLLVELKCLETGLIMNTECYNSNFINYV